MSTTTVHPEALGVQDLAQLMDEMCAVTNELQGTHDALRAEVSRLKGELADANARLRRSQALAALGEMAAGIAHEIRNPLGSIRLYAQVLQSDVADRPESAELCGKIERSVTTLDAIVRDVLQFARDFTARPVDTEPARLIEAALAQCEQLVVEQGATVDVSGAASPVPADQTLVVQALSNIVRNALEAMAEAGVDEPQLNVCCSDRWRRAPDGSDGHFVGIAIEDNGPGIPPEVVERIFNPFFTTRATGTGLGLAIVHRIVDAHGGHLDVRAARTGGACIELCLPHATVEANSSSAVCAPEGPIIETITPYARQTQDAP